MKYTILQAEVTISDERKFLNIVREIATENKVYITFFDADYIAGAEHVESAFLHALRAFCRGENISRTPDMEVLLYAAGTRQCSCAVQTGLKKGVRNYYILIFDLFDLSGCSGELSKGEADKIVTHEPAGLQSKNESDRYFTGESGENLNSELHDSLSHPKNSNKIIPDYFIFKNIPVIQRCLLGDDIFPEHFSGVLINLGVILVESIKYKEGKRNYFEGKESGLTLKEVEEFLESSESGKLNEFFEISDEEIHAAGTRRITDLVLERVTLLEINR